MSVTKKFDSLDWEFQYYCALVEELFGLVGNQQYIAGNWYRKLTHPIYNAEALREKRNKYLLTLSVCLILSDLKQPFDINPPSGPLLDISSIQNPGKLNLCCNPQCPKKQQKDQNQCDIHKNGCPTDSDNIGKVLDNQFSFLMNLSKPNVEKMSDPSNRQRGRAWIAYLTSIDTPCFEMKAVRNDYAMLLSGYVGNDELPGPFLQSPIIEKLIPLGELVKIIDMHNRMPIDPSQSHAMDFLKDVRHPTEGAFAFFAVTGNIFDS